MQYLIPKDKEMGVDDIQKIINSFETHEKPQMTKWIRYYDGNHDILRRTATDKGKKLNNTVVNYCRNCTDTYSGYLGGIPIRYSGEGLESVLDVLDYNDVHNEDNAELLNALKCGIAFEILYIDSEGKIRFKALPSTECIPVYNNDLDGELAYVIRYYKQQYPEPSEDQFYVEVYGKDKTTYYESSQGFMSYRLLGEKPNFFNQVPICVFDLNADDTSIFNPILNLNDAYNTLISGSVTAVEEWSDAYLILTGAIADEEDLVSMKEHRCLELDTGSTAEFLTKNVADTDVQNLLKLSNDQIHKIGQFPDFNDEKFMAQSGVAMKYKLISFENQSANIEARWKVALQKRIELICSILKLKGGEETWREVEIHFTRNLPISLEPETVTELMQLKGLVSDKSLLGLLPFIKDVDAEVAELEEQTKKSMERYTSQFLVNTDNNEEDYDE